MENDHFSLTSPPPLTQEKNIGSSTHYLIIRISDTGNIEIQGSRKELEEFLTECAKCGFMIELDHLCWCG